MLSESPTLPIEESSKAFKFMQELDKLSDDNLWMVSEFIKNKLDVNSKICDFDRLERIDGYVSIKRPEKNYTERKEVIAHLFNWALHEVHFSEDEIFFHDLLEEAKKYYKNVGIKIGGSEFKDEEVSELAYKKEDAKKISKVRKGEDSRKNNESLLVDSMEKADDIDWIVNDERFTTDTSNKFIFSAEIDNLNNPYDNFTEERVCFGGEYKLFMYEGE